MSVLSHRLDRTVEIEARPETVFSFFTDSDRWASWWGKGSTIDPRAGGRMYIRHPNGVEASGEVLEVVPPERIVFTYGFNSGQHVPPGGSRVTIRLEPIAQGTRLHLLHEFADAKARDDHEQGWRYQMSVFANVVADAIHARNEDIVDAWLSAWSDTDAGAREKRLASIAIRGVRFRDRFSLLNGLADLVPHIGAAQRFMPDMHLKRRGDVRHCQGRLLVDWIATSAAGEERGSGQNVFTLGPDGLIEDVTGFWNLPKGN